VNEIIQRAHSIRTGRAVHKLYALLRPHRYQLPVDNDVQAESYGSHDGKGGGMWLV